MSMGYRSLSNPTWLEDPPAARHFIIPEKGIIWIIPPQHAIHIPFIFLPYTRNTIHLPFTIHIPLIFLSCSIYIQRPTVYGDFLSHGASPSYHPFLVGIFHEINHPANLGVSPMYEPPPT